MVPPSKAQHHRWRHTVENITGAKKRYRDKYHIHIGVYPLLSFSNSPFLRTAPNAAHSSPSSKPTSITSVSDAPSTCFASAYYAPFTASSLSFTRLFKTLIFVTNIHSCVTLVSPLESAIDIAASAKSAQGNSSSSSPPLTLYCHTFHSVSFYIRSFFCVLQCLSNNFCSNFATLYVVSSYSECWQFWMISSMMPSLFYHYSHHQPQLVSIVLQIC